jgi:hypothetical protein
MMFTKRAAVAAVLLLAPVPASADRFDSTIFDAAKDMFEAHGEAFGYLETCRQGADRSQYRRAHAASMVKDVFPEFKDRMLSIAYDMGRSKGMSATCSAKMPAILEQRVVTSLEDLMAAMKRSVSEYEAKHLGANRK